MALAFSAHFAEAASEPRNTGSPRSRVRSSNMARCKAFSVQSSKTAAKSSRNGRETFRSSPFPSRSSRRAIQPDS